MKVQTKDEKDDFVQKAKDKLALGQNELHKQMAGWQHLWRWLVVWLAGRLVGDDFDLLQAADSEMEKAKADLQEETNGGCIDLKAALKHLLKAYKCIQATQAKGTCARRHMRDAIVYAALAISGHIRKTFLDTITDAFIDADLEPQSRLLESQILNAYHHLFPALNPDAFRSKVKYMRNNRPVRPNRRNRCCGFF